MLKIELVETTFGGDIVRVTHQIGEMTETQSFKEKEFKLLVREDGTFSIDPVRRD